MSLRQAGFIEYRFDTAREFLDALRLSNSQWWTDNPLDEPDRDWHRDWIFRGQGSATWSLLPSAWREPIPDSLTKIKETIGNRVGIDVQIKIKKQQVASFFPHLAGKDQQEVLYRIVLAVLQATTEVVLITEFTELADELGFKISRLSSRTRGSFVSEYIENILRDIESQTEFWTNSAVALAQHHGIPTRLLDWTRSPVAAAFFAAASTPDPINDDCLVVFALHKLMLRNHIRLVEVPASDDDFLRAQSGLFTLDTKGDELFVEHGCYLGLEESISYIDSLFADVVQPKKLLLPVSQAPELLRLLWLERVTQAHLMPALDHVAQTVKTKVRLMGTTIAMEQEEPSGL